MRNNGKKIAITLVIISLLSSVLISSSCKNKAAAEDNRFLELLKLLPESAKHSDGFELIDYERIWRDNGISLYSPEGQKISRSDFIESLITIIIYEEKPFYGVNALADGSYYSGWGQYIMNSTIKDGYVGYDLTDVKAEINNFNVTSPENIVKSDFVPDYFMAAIGTYNPKDTDVALKNHSEWPSPLINIYTTEIYRDITIHSWGDGNEQRLEMRLSPPHVDMVGRAMPLAVTDGHLFIGSSVENIKSMIDTSLDKSRSLADIPEYALIAERMASLGVYRVLIHETTTEDDVFNLLVPSMDFLTVSYSYGRDEQGDFTAVIAVYENENLAEESEGIQKEGLAERLMKFGIETDYIDIRRDGRILCIKFNTPGLY